MTGRLIILASSSPRRKQLLEMVGLDFEVVPSSFEENITKDMDPYELVEYLSFQKAQDVATKYTDAVVIAADTVVVLDDIVIGKPKDKRHAVSILRALSNKSHRVITGYTIIVSPIYQRITNTITSTVYFRKLNQKEIQDYVATGEPMDKAGAYGIQGLGSIFIEKIEGDYCNVVGLPVYHLLEDLKKVLG